MPTLTLPEALTREHRDIDAGVEEFVEGLERGAVLAEPLRIAFTALRRHIYLEEQFLFPPIRAEGLTMPILVMLREHGTLWQQMELDQHNSKEEPIVYPHAETALAPKAAADLETFLRSGSMPEGWVCEGVR